MDEPTTTTEEAQPVAGADEALPVNADAPVVADEQTSPEPSEAQPDVKEAEPQPTDAPKVDDKLQKYAQSQGFELDSPGAIKAAQAGLKAQAEATKNYQKASELEKAAQVTQDQLPADASATDVDNARLKNLELKYEISTWKNQNQDKLALEADMVKILSDPNKKALVQEGYLSLDDVYKLAKADSPDNSAQVKSDGKREALQSLAHKQQAAVPAGHATTSDSPKEKPFAELSIQEMEARLGTVQR